jgi:hypothetical protein
LLIDDWLAKWSDKALSGRCEKGEAVAAFEELELALDEIFSYYPRAREAQMVRLMR